MQNESEEGFNYSFWSISNNEKEKRFTPASVCSVRILIAAPETCFHSDSRADVMNFTSDDGLREQKSCISMK